MNILIDLGSQLVAEAIHQFLVSDGSDTVMKSPTDDFMPQVVLVDVSTARHSLLRRYPGARFLLIDAGEGTEKVLSILLSLDIHGVLSTQVGLHLLKKALTAVSEGHVWIDSDTLKTVLEDTGALTKKGGIKGITERHQDIIDCVCQGLSNKEISQKLGLSPDTVKAHLNTIFKKLHISSREQLMALALDQPKHALARSA